MNKKMIFVWGAVLLALIGFVAVLVCMSARDKQIAPIPKMVKPDTSAPHFPE